MREILFRAWDTKKKCHYSCEEMVADELTLLPDGRFINVSSVDTRMSRILDHLIPEQYTGLDDKNGVKIFEGDTLGLDGNWFGCVKWSDFGFCMDFLNGNELRWNLYEYKVRDMEVIGSIHDEGVAG